MESDGAKLHILNVNIQLKKDILLLRMRKLPAIKRANGIYSAAVVFIQKVAGSFPVNDVAGFILFQVLRPILFFTHADMRCNPLHLCLCVGGCHYLTAVGALSAVNLAISLLIQAIKFG